MGGFALLLIGIGLMQSISPAIHDSEFFKIFVAGQMIVLYGE